MIFTHTFLRRGGNIKKVTLLGFWQKNKAIELARPYFHDFNLPIAWDKKIEILSLEEKGALSIVRLMLFDKN
ncbi:MAG: hypothetical protein KAT05_04670, partial [Spirochaetes bacterium]|nr:hypothetical protein [Spirochaetota bacterium]